MSSNWLKCRIVFVRAERIASERSTTSVRRATTGSGSAATDPAMTGGMMSVRELSRGKLSLTALEDTR